MKITSSFIASSLLALTLVTAHGAEKTINPANDRSILPIKKEINTYWQEKEEQPVVVILHQNNDGAKVTIPNGALVKVILKIQIASTGFDWTPSLSSPDVLEYQDRQIRPVTSYLLGAPSQVCWMFKATAAGQTTLTFSLTRPWEKNEPALQTIHFDLTVE